MARPRAAEATASTPFDGQQQQQYREMKRFVREVWLPLSPCLPRHSAPSFARSGGVTGTVPPVQ